MSPEPQMSPVPAPPLSPSPLKKPNHGSEGGGSGDIGVPRTPSSEEERGGNGPTRAFRPESGCAARRPGPGPEGFDGAVPSPANGLRYLAGGPPPTPSPGPGAGPPKPTPWRLPMLPRETVPEWAARCRMARELAGAPPPLAEPPRSDAL